MAIYQSREGFVDHYLGQVKQKFMKQSDTGELTANYELLATILENLATQLRSQAKTLKTI